MFRKFRHRVLEPAITKLILFIGRYCPGFITHTFASLAGFFAGPFISRAGTVLDVNRRNIAIPLGLKVNAYQVVNSTACCFFDFLRFSRFSDDHFKRVVEVQGREHILNALEKGRGVIAITAHYSAWELIPRAVSLLGARVGVVGRKLWNPRVSQELDNLRSKPGIELIDRGASAVGLIRSLRRNTAVGILIDQDTITVESRFIPFLGLEARTPVGPAGIALRYGVPILTLHIARKSKTRYLLTIDPVVNTEGFQNEDGVEKLTAELNRRIGEWIVEDPDQWIWFHKRWDRRPPGSDGLR